MKSLLRFQFVKLLCVLVVCLVFPRMGICQVNPFEAEVTGLGISGSSGPSRIEKAEVSEDYQAIKDFNAKNDKVVIDRYYFPIAHWTGRLVLPSPAKRLPDGSVYIYLTGAAKPGMAGKTFRLVRKQRDENDEWVEKLRTDVNIAEKVLSAARKSGDKIPFALNGLKNVSSLESLAAARPREMDVAIPEPEISGDVLIIRDDPIQISGARKALVRFVGPAKGSYRRITHYNAAAGSFSGPSEYVSIPDFFFRDSKKDVVPMSSTVDIENARSNEEGWYVYGSYRAGLFHVEALEPRSALKVGNPPAISGSAQIKEYLAKSAYADIRTDFSRQVQWLPADKQDDNWPVGTRGLLIHAFGWRKSSLEKNNSGIILGLVTGHFAFGQAEVVKCSITGEPRWDIDYFQIYVHNRNHIVSCAQKWHAYVGNLRRGWMYTVPVIDTIVKLPENGVIKTATGEINMFRLLRKEFEKMMAVYRTGSGTGATAVRTDVSCVQDSHAALYAFFRELQSLLKKENANPAAIEAESFVGARIEKLIKGIEANITFHGIPSGKWKAFYDNPDRQRYTNPFTVVFDTMLSAGTMFPRNANDKMIEMFAEHGLPMYNILISQAGGKIDKLVPVAPSSPRRR